MKQFKNGKLQEIRRILLSNDKQLMVRHIIKFIDLNAPKIIISWIFTMTYEMNYA